MFVCLSFPNSSNYRDQNVAWNATSGRSIIEDNYCPRRIPVVSDIILDLRNAVDPIIDVAAVVEIKFNSIQSSFEEDAFIRIHIQTIQ